MADQRNWAEFGDRLCREITVAQAAAIRFMRVDEGLTWRGVAERFAEEFPGELIDSAEAANQGVGMYLSKAAAVALGENPDAEPWN